MEGLRQGSLIGIIVLAGAAAGTIHGAANLAMVEPFLDIAIEAENTALFESGEASDTVEFRAQYEQYRMWQKGGQVLAGAILGAAFGSLFGIVYALSRASLPGRHDIGKALALAGIMWVVVFLVPFAKYPAELPATGDPDTVDDRLMLYAGLMAVSGAAAVGSHRLYGAVRRAGGGVGCGRRALAGAVAVLAYAAAVSAAWAAFPDAGDLGPAGPAGGQEAVPADTAAFRAASIAGVGVFWASAAVILGALWRRAVRGEAAEAARAGADPGAGGP